jgi:hypothetical protein
MATGEWYDHHWLVVALSTTVGLTAFFIYLEIRSGFIWITVVFGVTAGLSLLTLLVRLAFLAFRRPR